MNKSEGTFLMKNILYTLVLNFLLSCTASSEFQAGQCIQAKDKYIYKISRVEGNNYVVQGWLPKWGNETQLSKDILSHKHGHKIINCPSL